MAILEAIKLTKKVRSPAGQITIVDQVSFTIEAGESVAICGPSGAGKSTLLALLAGLDDPTSGELRISGRAWHDASDDERTRWRAEEIGFVFQSFHLIPGLTAYENVLLPLEIAHDPEADKKARSALNDLGLSERLSHYPKHLSGGEQQRVAIARAMVRKPKLLFADEPTGNLDERNGQLIMDQLFDLNRRENLTVVIITHEPKLAARCDRILWMTNGQVAQS